MIRLQQINLKQVVRPINSANCQLIPFNGSTHYTQAQNYCCCKPVMMLKSDRASKYATVHHVFNYVWSQYHDLIC